jgi:polygalacturonase
LVVPAGGSRNADGAYYSGAITLLSNVDLDMDTGATAKFVRNPTNAYYPLVLTSHSGADFYNFSPMVYALNQTNIALTGGGTLDAQYNVSPWALPSSSPMAGKETVLLGMSEAGVPVTQWIFTSDGSLPSQIPVLQGCPAQAHDWGPCKTGQYIAPPPGTTAYQSSVLPQFVEFNTARTILVQDIHLVNPQFVQLHPLNSEYITINNGGRGPECSPPSTVSGAAQGGAGVPLPQSPF